MSSSSSSSSLIRVTPAPIPSSSGEGVANFTRSNPRLSQPSLSRDQHQLIQHHNVILLRTSTAEAQCASFVQSPSPVDPNHTYLNLTLFSAGCPNEDDQTTPPRSNRGGGGGVLASMSLERSGPCHDALTDASSVSASIRRVVSTVLLFMTAAVAGKFTLN